MVRRDLYAKPIKRDLVVRPLADVAEEQRIKVFAMGGEELKKRPQLIHDTCTLDRVLGAVHA